VAIEREHVANEQHFLQVRDFHAMEAALAAAEEQAKSERIPVYSPRNYEGVNAMPGRGKPDAVYKGMAIYEVDDLDEGDEK
jgi:hypothetical protein